MRCPIRSLLLVRAALGKIYDYESVVNDETQALKMPPKDTRSGLLYDSVQGGPHRPSQSGPGERNSVIWVVYETAQVYPEYVVKYTPPS